MNSLFRTGVPPATHLIKTGFLKVQLFNIEMLQIQMSYVSNCNAYWTKGPNAENCDGITFVNISLVYQSRELCTDKRILFQKAKHDLYLSLTSVWLGQIEHLQVDHRCSCCKPRCRKQKHCNSSPRPRYRIYMPPLNVSYLQTLDQPFACENRWQF